jgi:3-phenylpropionate/trans-cinnamate dioxygenase ferredoxin reductase subunit
MEYRGWAPEFDQVVFRGDRGSREFIAFWLRDDKVLAAMNVNTWGLGEAIEALVRAQQPVDPSDLVDPDADLAALVRRPGKRRALLP